MKKKEIEELKKNATERDKKCAPLLAELDVIRGNIDYYKQMAVYFPGFAKKRLEELQLKLMDTEKKLIDEMNACEKYFK